MRKFICFFVFSLLCFATVFSQENDKSESTTESWYTYWGIGYASASYPSDMQELIDVLNEQEGVSQSSLSIDALGFYVHIDPKTIIGGILNGVADRYSFGEDHMQFNQYLIGASVMHYLGQSFGKGIFIRADAGFSAIIVSTSGGGDPIRKSGLGFLGGGGWSFDLGGTRLLLNMNYAVRVVEGDTYNALALSVGGLF